MNNICFYCGKDAGRTELGMRQGTHPHHRAGTPYWRKWYKAERAAGRYRSEIADTILAAAEARSEKGKARLAAFLEAQRERNG